MAVPWRAAEAMHWQLGEADMARRAGVVPFSLSNVPLDMPPSGHHSSPTRGHSHAQTHAGAISGTGTTNAGSSRYCRPATSHSYSSSRGNSNAGRSIAARRESTPRSVPLPSPSDGLALAAIGGGMGRGGLGGHGGQMLPSVAEITTGVSPYSTPAYMMSMPVGGGHPSPSPLLPALGMMGVGGGVRQDFKRRASPEMFARETSRRRQ